jgi:hypothetical protein
MQWQASGCCPEFDLMAVTVATMAVVPAQVHVHGEAGPSARGTVRQGTTAVPLIASATGGLEAKQLKYLLDSDLLPELIEVDARHVGFLVDAGGSWK